MNERKLVTLWERPSSDGEGMTYYLLYYDKNGKRRQKSLEHANLRKAERQRAKFEKALRLDYVIPGSLKIKEFTKDSLDRTGNQIRESTQTEYRSAMNDFRDKIGNVDFQQVTLDHAERYRQACLDAGNAPATVAKKIRHIKRFFQLAVNRRQREDNPFQNIDKPKVSKKKPRVFSQQEIDRIFKEAADLADTLNPGFNLKWNLLIWTALVTGMRRAELLNCTWSDIDFENGQLTVTAKADTPLTWLWMIKDSEERDVPLTEEILLELANHQATQPEGHPYVFVPPARYAYIQQLRRKGQWTLSDARLKVTTNFYPQFHRILKAAAVRKGKFHDFRRTAITNWFEEGLSEFEVMTLAGHSSFNTTHQFYLAVSGNLMDRARAASSKIVGSDLLQYCCSRPILKGTKKAVNRKSLTANHLNNGQGES